MFCGYFGGLERCVYTKLSDRLEHLTYDIIMEVVDAPPAIYTLREHALECPLLHYVLCHLCCFLSE